MEDFELIVKEYFEKNEVKKAADKIVKELGPKIKEFMKSFGGEKIVDGLKVSIRKSQKKTMNEEKLLEICKTLNQPNLIKTKEYVDEEVLETLIYNKIIKATDIEPAMEITESEALYVTKTK